MISPLEHEPELIAGIGLITVRWSALENELASLLGALLKAERVGEHAYYSLANFSQRIDFIEALLCSSLKFEQHRCIARAMFNKIKRLWKTRNYLVHSHYVYADVDHSGIGGALISAGKVLGPHPREQIVNRQMPVFIDENGNQTNLADRIKHHGFAYEKHNRDGTVERIFVNKGSFESHAKQLLKRTGNVRRFTKAVQTLEAPLRWTVSSTSHNRCSPRGTRNQKLFQDSLDKTQGR